LTNRIRSKDPCPCGSGRKYKRCCRLKQAEFAPGRRRRRMFRNVGLAIVGVGVLFGLVFHNLTESRGLAQQPSGTPLRAAPQDLATQPPGPAPPGKVWSSEHGHWHNLPEGSGESASNTPPGGPPPGPAPPGKVWSYEHGHWHNLPGGAPPPEGSGSTASGER